MVKDLLDKPDRPAGQSFEPLRPSDSKWRGRRGELRADLGPIYPLVNLKYSDGTVCVLRQEYGSGFACYPSGKKAVCVMCHHRSRRFSAMLYASSEFNVKSAVPEKSRPPYMRAPNAEEAAKRARANRTRSLGVLDEWGIGTLESVPDGTGVRGIYEVSATHVTIETGGPRGTRTRVSRESLAGDSLNAETLSLRLANELVVTYDNARGTTAIEFSSSGVVYTFHVGEVWKLPPAGREKVSQLQTTAPAAMFDAIDMAPKLAKLDATCSIMTENASYIKTDLKNSSSCLLSSTGASSLASLQTMKKSFSETTMKINTMNVTTESLKSLTDGRIDWHFEQKLRKKLRTDVHPQLENTQVPRPMKEGYLYPQQHPGKPPANSFVLYEPISLEQVSCYEVPMRVSSLDGGSLLVILVVASWAKKSQYSSSAHAQVACEAAHAELKAMGEDRVQFCVAELSEAGALHSTTKFSNPLVKQYGVREAPWLLMFSRGELVMSENPAGGIGFAHRLRYKAFAKPRVLVVEPSPTAQAAQAAAAATAAESEGRLKSTVRAVNNSQLQLETQKVLKQTGFDYDLAISSAEAMRLAAGAQPPYGILLCSSEVGSGVFSDVSSRLKDRNHKAVSFICHDLKALGPLQDDMQQLTLQKDLVTGVLRRPLTKSSLEGALVCNDDVRTQWPTCGMVKQNVVELIQRKLTSV
eukprot:TRINITY_DN104116_c0_g1_i1.p1 TRINITY_DN104116_c0_g1~~TRINITY_DN104116_c0_g1_i1.p1  ORF type:complete len:696 (-),score=116.01 TRINITY_DN104116_c0_g1_i1:164-2251(-)